MKFSLRLIIRIAVFVFTNLIFLVLLVSAGLSFMEWAMPQGDRQDAYIILFIIGAIAAYVLACGWYIALPIYHIIGQIGRLAIGDYSEAPKARRSDWLFRELICQLHTLGAELERSKRERMRLEDRQKEWMAGISHDLKTPLTYIKGYASMLRAPQYEWNPVEQSRFIAEIEQKACHMEALIGDLSLTFRLDEQSMPLQTTTRDLIEYVRRIVADVANDLRAMRHDLEFESLLDRAEMTFDSKLLQRALHNLLLNAVVHNPPGTRIRVTVLPGASLAIEISDNGRGMDEETVERLFQRYYRGTTTEDDSAGTGLGMAIARQIVAAHGGRIAVASRIGAGTSVTVRLPRAT